VCGRGEWKLASRVVVIVPKRDEPLGKGKDQNEAVPLLLYLLSRKRKGKGEEKGGRRYAL